MVNHTLRVDSGQAATKVILNNTIMENVRQIEALGKTQKVRNDYNNRIMKMINWVKQKLELEEIFADENLLIRTLTPKEKADKINYHKSTHDFIYENIPSSLIKSFLSDPEQTYKKT